ncbi:MAG: NAD-dependent epimerase/dehydratase family protein [Bacteroidales bacterium]|nr:NAD-dependent epimerase/dehydratase family protein [Bacteroidales bacterium]
MTQKITIIGGSGFVGTRLIDQLKEEFVVTNLDKRKSDFFPELTKICDVRDKKSLQQMMKTTDVIVLLAAEHRDDISPNSLYYDVNVEGTRNVLKIMEEKGIKNIIFTSSVAVFGLNKPNPDEKFPVDPFNHYGKSKYQAEKVLQAWQKSDNTRAVTVIRPTVIFGENNRGNVYNLLKQIASGHFRMVGKGINKKSMAYVGNIGAFIRYNIVNMQTGVQVYNYIDKPDLTMNQLIGQVEKSLSKKIPSTRLPYWLGMLAAYGFDLFSKLSGKKLSVSSVRVRKFCATTQFDASKAHSSGFLAPYTLTEGLNKTLQHEFLQKHDENRILFESE